MLQISAKNVALTRHKQYPATPLQPWAVSKNLIRGLFCPGASFAPLSLPFKHFIGMWHPLLLISFAWGCYNKRPSERRSRRRYGYITQGQTNSTLLESGLNPHTLRNSSHQRERGSPWLEHSGETTSCFWVNGVNGNQICSWGGGGWWWWRGHITYHS